MAGDIAYINEAFSESFRVVDSSNVDVTGLVNANFTSKATSINGTYAASPTFTVTEIDSSNAPGLYRIAITPDAVGDWALQFKHATHKPAGWTVNFQTVKRDPGFNVDANYDTAGSVLSVMVALSIDGERVTNPASCTVTIRTEDNVLIESETDSSADASGYFKMEFADTTLAAGVLYQMYITVTDANATAYDHELPFNAE